MEAQIEQQADNTGPEQVEDCEANTVEEVVNEVVSNAVGTDAKEVSTGDKKKIMKINAKHAKESKEEDDEEENESDDSQEEDDDEVSEESQDEEIPKSTKKVALDAKIVDKVRKLKNATQSTKEVVLKRKRSSSIETRSSDAKKQKVGSGVAKKVVSMKEPLKERGAKIKAGKANKAIAASGSRLKTSAKAKADLKKMEIKSKAKASKGVPDSRVASKKTKKSSRLSAKDAHIKYRTRLGLIPESEFEILDGAWISIYEPSIRDRKKFEVGFFPLKWTQILCEVAKEKGANILGCLPHYSKTIQGTDLKAYVAKPEIVDKDKEDDYHEAGYKNVQALRVYVGKKVGAGRETESQFAMLPSDHKADELWYAIKEVLDGDSEDDE